MLFQQGLVALTVFTSLVAANASPDAPVSDNLTKRGVDQKRSTDEQLAAAAMAKKLVRVRRSKPDRMHARHHGDIAARAAADATEEKRSEEPSEEEKRSLLGLTLGTSAGLNGITGSTEFILNNLIAQLGLSNALGAKEKRDVNTESVENLKRSLLGLTLGTSAGLNGITGSTEFILNNLIAQLGLSNALGAKEKRDLSPEESAAEEKKRSLLGLTLGTSYGLNGITGSTEFILNNLIAQLGLSNALGAKEKRDLTSEESDNLKRGLLGLTAGTGAGLTSATQSLAFILNNAVLQLGLSNALGAKEKRDLGSEDASEEEKRSLLGLTLGTSYGLNGITGSTEFILNNLIAQLGLSNALGAKEKRDLTSEESDNLKRGLLGLTAGTGAGLTSATQSLAYILNNAVIQLGLSQALGAKEKRDLGSEDASEEEKRSLLGLTLGTSAGLNGITGSTEFILNNLIAQLGLSNALGAKEKRDLTSEESENLKRSLLGLTAGTGAGLTASTQSLAAILNNAVIQLGLANALGPAKE